MCLVGGLRVAGDILTSTRAVWHGIGAPVNTVRQRPNTTVQFTVSSSFPPKQYYVIIVVPFH